MEYKQQKQDAEGSDYSFDKQLSAEDKKILIGEHLKGCFFYA